MILQTFSHIDRGDINSTIIIPAKRLLPIPRWRNDHGGIEFAAAPAKRQENMIDIRFPDFSGKTILLYLTDRSDEHNVVLQNASMENQAGKLFIVGEFAEGTTTNDWATGIRTAVAWENIEQYLVFDSIEDYFSRIGLGWESTTYQ